VNKIVRNGILAWGVVLTVLLIDQWIKIYIKLHFVLRESVEVTSWFYLSFIENNGMAYGLEVGDKLYLTIFRIIAVAFFGYFLAVAVRRNASRGLLICMAMAVAGAFGNILDCLFYGRLFTDSYGHVAQLAVDGVEGYAPWFRGRVVDMFYFPLIEFNWPDWVPVAGETVHCLGASFAWPSWLPCSNEPFRFFEPVFNFADASICVGFALLFLFYRGEVSRLTGEGRTSANEDRKSRDNARKEVES
jgi:signal peptidase II